MSGKPTYQELEKRIKRLENEAIESTRIYVELKRAYKVLEKNHRHLRAIIDNTNLPICLKDFEGKYIFINREFERLANISNVEIKGKNDFDVFPEPVATLFREQDEEIKKHNAPMDFVETIPLVDGEYTFITTKFPLFDPEGKIYAVGGICTDITSYKQMEESLRKNEALLTSILKSAPVGIGLVVDRVFHWTNQKLTEICGYSKKEFQGKSSRILYQDEEEFDRIGREKYNQISKYGTGSIETQLRRKDGATIDVFLSSTPLNPHDLSGGVIFTALDITSRKEAERSLRANEKRYREIYNATNEAIFIYDSEGGAIVEVNQAVEEMYGYTIEEVSRLTVDDLSAGKYPYTPKEARKKINKAAKYGAQTFEWLAKKKNDDHFWVEVVLKYTSFNNKPFFIAVVRDISDRKLMEEEMIKIRKLESLGVLAGGIAHDFNNILTSILANINLAELYVNSEEEKVQKLLREAEKASLRARDLTRQLLTFSKGGEPVKRLASIAEIIKDSAEFTLHGSNIKCEYKIADDLWPVEIDTGQMSQVVQNIIINASQAMPGGGIVEITCENFIKNAKQVLPLPDGYFVRISIRDRGIGMPAKLLNKIFDPYFTTKQKGSGLGLAITHSIITKHGGHIVVKTKKGQGTTFIIYLAAVEKRLLPEQKNELPLKIKGEKKVLFMDDEAVIRDSTEEILLYLGLDVVLVKDGEEAIEVYHKHMASGEPIDVVIMDLTIPGGLGGKAAVKKILELDPQAKVIVTSGYSNDPVMANYREFGFAGVIKKPFLVDELSEVIHKVLGS